MEVVEVAKVDVKIAFDLQYLVNLADVQLSSRILLKQYAVAWLSCNMAWSCRCVQLYAVNLPNF